MLLGLALGVAACDVIAFVVDPKPILEQTWNLPADSSQISVASLLPGNVSIYSTPASNPPDSSAFQVSLSNVNFSRRVGDDCAACVPLNGQTTIKPSFVLATGSSSSMPLNVVSGTLIGGQVTLALTNGFSFDPLRVKTIAPASTNPTQQGRLVIVIRSGSLVLGRDSLNGVTTAMPPGSVLNRTINLQTGNIGGALAVDVTLTSPQSDNNVPINANGLMNATMAVPDLRVASIRVNVVNRPLQNVGVDSIPLGELDEGITKHVTRGGLDMTVVNPFNISGSLSLQFQYGPSQFVTPNPITITPVGTQRSIVTLDSAQMSTLFSATQTVSLQVGGSVSSPGPVDLTPKQVLTLVNRLILTIRTPD